MLEHTQVDTFDGLSSPTMGGYVSGQRQASRAGPRYYVLQFEHTLYPCGHAQKKKAHQGVSSEDAAICDMAPVRSRRLKLARYTSIQYRYLALVRCGPILLTCLHIHTCRRC